MALAEIGIFESKKILTKDEPKAMDLSSEKEEVKVPADHYANLKSL